MEKLIRGVHKFQAAVFDSKRELFESLAEGQTPRALFITCSDSRIDPSLITQTEPGELFVLRNAGNIVPSHGPNPGGEVATIEYAVSVLEVRTIIVCGHSHCGAMAALMNPSTTEALPSVAGWLEHARGAREIMLQDYRHLEGSSLLTATIRENVLVQLEHLRTLPSVAARLRSEQLRLHGWVYKFETGEVLEFDPKHNAFVPLKIDRDAAE